MNSKTTYDRNQVIRAAAETRIAPTHIGAVGEALQRAAQAQQTAQQDNKRMSEKGREILSNYLAREQ